ncbi:MAG: hypothetical protein EBT03_12010, partial [Betaproteobacteria bacterium]|nr:hypothetical protein [Betaproteobacteria bacterium]
MADKPEELLTIQQQINKVLNDRLTILKSQESALMNQVQLAVDLCKSLKCEQLDDIEERLKSARDAMAAAAEEAAEFGTGLEESAGKGEKSVKSLDEAMAALRKRLDQVNPALKGFMLGLGGGLVKGVGSAWESIKNLNSMLFNVIKTLGGLALAIISIPFKIFQGIFELAQGSGGGPSPVLVELENVRKQFGNLATNEGRALKRSLVDIRDEYSNVAKSGLSIRRIFGPGLEGQAKYLEHNRELAEAMGNAYNGMMNIIENNSPELVIYRKGMG